MAKSKTDKTYTVHAAVPHFNGVRMGVTFADGKGEATKDQATRLVAYGYRCDALTKEPKPVEAEAKREAFREDLDQIKGIGKETAKLLVDKGIEGVSVLAVTDAVTLSEAAEISLDKVSAWVDAAKVLVAEADKAA